ncbi:MAG: carboxypeptidase-like regulatory domain-containing protein [Acidimicrobiia bacterium]
MRAWRPAAAMVLAVVLGAGAACSSDDGQELPAPNPSSTTTTTVPVDFSEVALAPIAPGKEPPVTRPPGPGKASIAGRVVDTAGAPIPQALVRATYFFDPAKPEVIEALSGEDGSYRFDKLYGGRWRIRAWKAPLLATFEQPAFFLGAAEQKALDLKVKEVPDADVTSTMAPDPPLVGWLAELAVLVVAQTVDLEGRVERTPVGGVPVSLAGDGSWSLSQPGTPTQLTEGDGTVRWTMSCGSEGVHTLSVKVAFLTGVREYPVASPSCLSPASTTTATTATTGPSSSTSSTKPKAKTTTTTRPRTTSSTRSGVQPR